MMFFCNYLSGLSSAEFIPSKKRKALYNTISIEKFSGSCGINSALRVNSVPNLILSNYCVE